MISTANITMQFGAEPLFENISAKFGNGNRYGLIGANGCGKSTFMKILSGALTPSAGNVSISQGQRLGTLSQDQFAFEQYTVVDAVIMGDAALWKVKQERDRIYSLPEMTEEDGMAVAELESEFAEMDGYTAESRAGQLLIDAGIDEELHYGLMSQVAPGWKLRVLLAQALFSNPDILLLDEPTNNLDIHTINWLAGELNQRKCTMIIISHDRHFLNSVCTHMADIDYGELRIYPGNYEKFIEASTLIQEQLLSENAKKSAEINELQDFVNRFGANASKAKQASSRAKKMDKIKLDEVKSSSRLKPSLQFKPGKALYRQALILEELAHGFDGETLFEGGDLILDAGSKLAIIGENGVGKTTMLRCLVNELKHNHGVIKWSENASIGYCPQDSSSEFNNDLGIFDWISQWRTKDHDDLAVRSILGRLLFTADDINKKVKNCSGGEKNRLLFGKLMMLNINVLVMDEPTNHMDMEAIEALNNALKVYEGTLIFVSHDREFVSSLATRIIDIRDKKVVNFHGTFDEYMSNLALEEKVA
ncbi:ABC-F family ATPase [Photobacterium sp. NCIMB 13483]|uniref:Probable ATP-binding protein YbiT n=1 Tax=Photobacterium piscicola TaxID=1378299 RepID=A0A1T5HX95_9GAMM|nr:MULTISPECIES: ABC-F family ATPase [Photobacterium]MEC6823955.1 ABC-F family ATPase [Photobacterium piscicola]MEC6882206.1 ABC-F family ATPase [Photobacterium piscicola]MEC6899850.1 ABC-F family ATPase [Photobacterium piscicola]PST94442.1 ABC-F family ATPase [Photobacterium sp. NCIMB 13483]SKC31316.1 putative ABC transporter ATP-binding protein [Photobacterium piscicola]